MHGSVRAEAGNRPRPTRPGASGKPDNLLLSLSTSDFERDSRFYRWLYVYGFVHPASGRNLELLLPSANADWMGPALEEFARWADPEGRKQLVVLLDNAGWHVARRLAVPANVAPRRLPPCTPELQPAEPLWPPVREAVADEEMILVTIPTSCDRRRGQHPVATRWKSGSPPET
jgi:hypothetical protein